jgi:ElaA protein
MQELIFDLKTFAQMDTRLLYEMGRLRQEVFIIEQECPYLDFDGRDYNAHHIFGYENETREEIAAYCRILPPKMNYDAQACIGRVVTPTKLRGRDYGRKLMREAVAACLRLYPATEIRISAQSRLVKFYQELGFVATTKEYLEDNIPHTEMYYPIV